MKNLKHTLSVANRSNPIVYALICFNDKFYVGETINFGSRMKYGHFGIYENRLQYIKSNPPLDMLFIIEIETLYSNTIYVRSVEDYVTVVLSKKYGAANVYGGFRHLKSSIDRSKFVENYDYVENKEAVELVNSKIDFELPELYEIQEAMYSYYGDLNEISEFEMLEMQYQLRRE